MQGGVVLKASCTMFGLAFCAALALLSAETSVAGTGSRQTAEAKFVEQRPGVTSALRFRVDYVNPDDPSGKPPAVRTVVETLAQGGRFDTSVPEQCGATDAQLMLQGESACPPGSKVGTGYLRLDTGFPEPLRFFDEDVAFFNNANQLIFLTTDRGTGAHVVARAAIQGGRLTSSAPPLPGTPPDGGAIDVVRTNLDSIHRVVGGEVRGYITTPHSCPSSGQWVNSLSFTYADGVTQSVKSPSPCMPQPARCARLWRGSSGPDRHVGTRSGDRLLGLRGDDRLQGGRGDDCLYGGRGADVLRGGPGQDLLVGGPGHDACYGGGGRDQFRGCERLSPPIDDGEPDDERATTGLEPTLR